MEILKTDNLTLLKIKDLAIKQENPLQEKGNKQTGCLKTTTKDSTTWNSKQLREK